MRFVSWKGVLTFPIIVRVVGPHSLHAYPHGDSGGSRGSYRNGVIAVGLEGTGRDMHGELIDRPERQQNFDRSLLEGLGLFCCVGDGRESRSLLTWLEKRLFGRYRFS